MGTKITVDHDKAELLLEKAFADSSDVFITSADKKMINCFLFEIGITYRYIFLTGLLAKSTNKKANPIVLQASSPLDGAFDARSLCHKVIVKNSKVNAIVGGSNEPFLNKPARIPSLDRQVAFKSTLIENGVKSMIAFFNKLKGSEDSYSFLVYSLHELNVVAQANSITVDDILKTLKENTSINSQRRDVLTFYKSVLEKCCEGESLVLCVHTALHCLYRNFDNIEIVAHPSNESGASSKEIEDIDVFVDSQAFMSLELKDKNYDINDLTIVANKCIKNGVDSVFFVTGNNASYIGDETDLKTFRGSMEQSKIVFTIVEANEFLTYLLNLCSKIDIVSIVQSGLITSKIIRAKQKTIDNWFDVAKRLIKE